MRPRPRATARARRRIATRNLVAPRWAEERYVRGLRGVLARVHEETLRRLDGAEADTAPRVALLFQEMALEVRLANREATMRALGFTPGADLAVERAILIAREANIRLVEDAARAYAEDVREVLADPASIGLSAPALKEKLLERGSVSLARAELIARDQTLKLNGAINQARQEAAGVEEYTWSTVGDDRVRPTHRAHEGRRYRWDAPPAVTGPPGFDFQCRCVAIPVLSEFGGI